MQKIFQAKDNGISIKLEDWEDEQRNYCSGQNPSDVPAHKREQRRGMLFRWNCVPDNTERCVLPFAVWKQAGLVPDQTNAGKEKSVRKVSAAGWNACWEKILKGGKDNA